jgi:hypothetical protein
MRYLFACLFAICPFAAAAQSPPASMADCERIRSDLAYNQCLASFGPKRGERPAREETADDEEPAAAQRSGRRGRTAGRGGRQAAAFDVVSGRGGAPRSARGRTRR